MAEEPTTRSVCRTADHRGVPPISVFYGIVIAMYDRDHSLPHFHALYGGYEATIVIATLEVLSGSLPPRPLGLVGEWAAARSDELGLNWQRARDHLPLDSIEPLP